MSTLAAYQKISTSLLTQKYKIWSNLVLFGLIQSILSTLILFSPLWSFAVNFGPLRSTMVLIGLIQFTSVLFNLFYFSPLWFYLVLFYPLWSYSVHFGIIQFTLIIFSLFGPILSTSVYLVYFVEFGPFVSTSVHFCALTYLISFWPKKIWPSNLDNLVDNLEAVWFRCFSHPLLPFGGSHA